MRLKKPESPNGPDGTESRLQDAHPQTIAMNTLDKRQTICTEGP